MENNNEIKIVNPYGFIYITTNMINGKKYVGRCCLETTRKNSWKNYLGSGKVLEKAIKKYGRENFSRTIISFAYTNEELNKQEMELIKFLDASNSDDYYNISDKYYYNFWEHATELEKKQLKEKMSKNSFWNTATEEDIQKRKEALRNQALGENNPFYNKKHTAETLRKLSESHKGKTCGDDNVKYWKGKTGELHHFYGKHHSDKSKKQMSKSAKDRVLRDGAPNCKPMSIIIDEKIINFKTQKECYDYCKDNKLIPNIYHKKQPYSMLCYDSFKKRIYKKEPFLLFTYKIDGEV